MSCSVGLEHGEDLHPNHASTKALAGPYIFCLYPLPPTHLTPGRGMTAPFAASEQTGCAKPTTANVLVPEFRRTNAKRARLLDIGLICRNFWLLTPEGTRRAERIARRLPREMIKPREWARYFRDSNPNTEFRHPNNRRALLRVDLSVPERLRRF